ncbi:hypothetical protein QYM36_015738 [Artemia franciscana]|uniref:PiggyBac transposable element-derived protein domain-containing protein n=1 Tax=Artemia franciscana TaxID=6661 RepID=A0AA88L2J2_ARTSF|nr:hypothetical protein QYM36_015738 [Artemia franciscana]
MGGVDLSEMLIELYRTDIRGKKWYESLLLPLGFFSRQHTVDLSASYGSARPNPLKEPLRLQKRNRLTFTFTSAQLQDLIEDPSKTKTVPLQIDQSLPNHSHMIVFTMKASSIGRMQWLIRSNAGAALLILESNVQTETGEGTLCIIKTKSAYRVETNSGIVAMKWFDNKSVCIASSFVGAEPSGNYKHRDSKLKKQIDVVRLLCIAECNKFTGGVDLSDMLIGLYRIDTRRRKWYMRLFYYFLDVSVFNALFLYQRHIGQHGRTHKKSF